MATISQLPVKTLVKILTHLRNGNIGFDPYRDTATNSKAKLLSYIVANFDNQAIINSVKAVCDAAETPQEISPYGVIDHTNAKQCPVYVKYHDVNRASHTVGFGDLASADAFIARNPSNQYTGKIAGPLNAVVPSVFEPSIFEKSQDAAIKPSAPKTPTDEAPRLPALLSQMAAKQAGAALDESKVQAICDARANNYIDNILTAVNGRLDGFETSIQKLSVPVIVHVLKTETQEVKSLGVQHKNFPKLLKTCQAREASGHRLNIWLYGPAGTGKTHAAHAVADALSLPFQSNGTLLTEHSLSGFIDAGGKYHRTAFREVFEHGGVYLGDEYDCWCPKAAMWLQAALANGYTRFPDGMIKRHSDCVIIFGANTTGKGATSEYSTRNKIDDANGNRVVFLEWPLDQALELAISPDTKWTKRVQEVRANVEKRKLKGHMITPRQSMQGAALLQAGLEWSEVEAMVLRRGLSDDQWATVQ